MVDIKRMNEIIRFAINDRREECKTDAERARYDSIKRQMALQEEYGIGMDLIHETIAD
jgi:hypothetical protein